MTTLDKGRNVGNRLQNQNMSTKTTKILIPIMINFRNVCQYGTVFWDMTPYTARYMFIAVSEEHTVSVL
jgi:hypothetical protein